MCKYDDTYTQMSFILCDVLIYVFPACFEFSKAGLYHLACHVCSLSHNASPCPPPPLKLQSVVDVGFQCSLPPFLTLFGHCLHDFYSHYFLILFSLISPSCTYWSSSFSCSFHFSCCNLFWHLVLHSFNILDGEIL